MTGRYRLVESIGQGGMGRVWRAADEMLDRRVAVKEMRIDGLDQEDTRTRRERTLREARATARIDHPNVVRIYDVVDEGERLWIVMELVAGRSLEQIVTEDGPLGPRAAARLGLGLVAALREVHAGGVLHRDIKPGNVLVERRGRRVVLTDFGIAAMQDAEALTMVGMLVGSPDYMAPERVSGRPQGPPSDVWSLGATLCAALGGHSPFSRSTTLATLHAVLYEEPELPPCAGELRAILAALLEKEPAGRPGLEELETALTPIADLPRQPTSRQPTSRQPGTPEQPDAQPPLLPDAPVSPVASSPASPASPSAPLDSPTQIFARRVPVQDAIPVPRTTSVAPIHASAEVPSQAPSEVRSEIGTRPRHQPSTKEPSTTEPSTKEPSEEEAPTEEAPTEEAPAEEAPAEEVPHAAAATVSRLPSVPAPLTGHPAQPPGPAAPFTSRHRRRRRGFVAAGGVVIAGAVAGLLIATNGGASDDPNGGSAASSAPAVASSAPATSSGGGSATGSPSSPSTSPTVEGTSRPPSLPPGAHREAGGFAWATPKGWRRDVKTGAEVHYTSPDGRQELVAKSAIARGDLMETWRTSEQNAHRGQDYRKIRLEKTMFRGWSAVVWEYTFTLQGVPWHAQLLGFDTDGKSYQINTWYQPETENAALRTYEQVKKSFTVL
ncbi:serine/threonine-protein kinase [Streptomyces sp. NPDC058274]|uniref:serine/threonine-protein kinase n=1 Tax=Streptomyces sp. NPDC058274 TaxID=3346416 RepID=UPI0036F03F88